MPMYNRSSLNRLSLLIGCLQDRNIYIHLPVLSSYRGALKGNIEDISKSTILITRCPRTPPRFMKKNTYKM